MARMRPESTPVENLTHRIDRIGERQLVLLALRTPVDTDWCTPPLGYRGEPVAPYRSFFSVLASALTNEIRRAWVVVEFSPGLAARRDLALPAKPGDIDMVVGTLTDTDEIDLDAPILGVEVGTVPLGYDEARRERDLGDERKDQQAEDLCRWPFEMVAVAGLVPEQTTDARFSDGSLRHGHEQTISPESLRPELDRFGAPLGLLAATLSSAPCTDPSRRGIGLAPTWLRPPRPRCFVRDGLWLGLRRELRRTLQTGVARLLVHGGPYLVIKCRDQKCRRWVMFPQTTPYASTLEPPCGEHASPKMNGDPDPAILSRVLSPIRVRFTEG